MIVSSDFIKKHHCVTKMGHCKHLKILTIKDIDGVYRSFYNCVSEEELCCGCCRDMESKKSFVKLKKFLRECNDSGDKTA